MLVGHVAVGLVAKRVVPRVSLGTLLLSSLLADLLWCVFLIAGIERVQLRQARGRRITSSTPTSLSVTAC